MSGRRLKAREDGSATVWVLGAGALVLAIAFAVLTATTAILVRHRIENAADLAAISGALRIGVGTDPCAAAAALAQANGSALTRCELALSLDGRSGSIVIRVQRSVSLLGIGSRSVSASARAERLPG